ncbi:MAG: hypothetical protein M3040_01020 [Bacteroidota bacterium]|nr:hypothetical protein [Bacteroidota bacterium]
MSILTRVLQHCCDILLADGIITEEEKQTLQIIAELSGIGETTAQKIVDVALLRNIKDD